MVVTVVAQAATGPMSRGARGVTSGPGRIEGRLRRNVSVVGTIAGCVLEFVVLGTHPVLDKRIVRQRAQLSTDEYQRSSDTQKSVCT